MRFLVSFVTLLSITTCLAWNLPEQVQDTPEVAAAKAAHLAALAKAKEKTREKAKYSQDSTSKKDKYPLKKGDTKESWKNSWEKDGAWDAVGDSGSQNEDDGSWKGDESWKNYDDGSWMEEKATTEKPKHEGSWDNARWTGPVALPPGYDEFGAPLPVEDTPEVADAKAKHMLLYAKAVSRGHAEPLQPSPIALKSQTSEAHRSRQPPSNNAIYVAPGKPAVRLPSGRSAPPPQHPAPVWETNDEVQDTPEVAAAKAAHYAAHARKRANA